MLFSKKKVRVLEEEKERLEEENKRLQLEVQTLREKLKLMQEEIQSKEKVIRNLQTELFHLNEMKKLSPTEFLLTKKIIEKSHKKIKPIKIVNDEIIVFSSRSVTGIVSSLIFYYYRKDSNPSIYFIPLIEEWHEILPSPFHSRNFSHAKEVWFLDLPLFWKKENLEYILDLQKKTEVYFFDHHVSSSIGKKKIRNFFFGEDKRTPEILNEYLSKRFNYGEVISKAEKILNLDIKEKMHALYALHEIGDKKVPKEIFQTWKEGKSIEDNPYLMEEVKEGYAHERYTRKILEVNGIEKGKGYQILKILPKDKCWMKERALFYRARRDNLLSILISYSKEFVKLIIANPSNYNALELANYLSGFMKGKILFGDKDIGVVKIPFQKFDKNLLKKVVKEYINQNFIYQHEKHLY